MAHRSSPRSAACRFVVHCAVLAWLTTLDGSTRAEEFVLDGLRSVQVDGYWPVAADLADLDCDGDDDLVVVQTGDFRDGDGWQGSTVTVLPNPGNGFFGPSTSYSVPSAPYDLAICDLNGDLSLDLATPNAAPDNVSILFNDGTGVFTPGPIVPVGVDPVGIACADFDLDGWMDLAVADQFFGVSILRNEGQGASFAVQFLPLGDIVNTIAAADLDADGDADILAFCNDDTFLFRNLGPLGFSEPPIVTAVGTVASRPRLCFFDGDASLDLVGAEAVWLDGLTTRYLTGLTGPYVRCHDFDGDGRPDVVTNDAIALSNGDGTFAPPIETDAPSLQSYKGPIAIGQLVGTSTPDLVSVHGGPAFAGVTPGFVTLLAGIPDGVERVTSVPGGDSVWKMTGGLLDDDQDVDLVVLNVGTTNSFLNGSVSVLRGRGDGRFDPLASYPAGNRVRSGVVVDLDSDHAPDVAVTNFDASTVSVLRNDGHGQLLPRTTFPAGAFPEALAPGNLDGNTGVDLAVANHVDAGTVSILLGSGLGGLAAPLTFPTGCARPTSIVAAHLNADPYLDLAVTCLGRPIGGTWTGMRVVALMGAGNGSFGSPVILVDPTESMQSVTACDLDRDGDQDLVAAGTNRDSPRLTSRVFAFMNNGSGSFPTVRTLDLPMDVSAVTIACSDLTRDGVPDLLLPYQSANVLSLLPGLGDGTFGRATHYATHEEPRVPFIADFDRDGEPDIAVAGSGRDDVTILLNRGPAPANLLFLGDKATLTWPAVAGAASYDVYRGPLSELADSNGDRLPDEGYGECANPLDGSLTDTIFVDPEIPDAPGGFFYLVGFVGLHGEGGLGFTSARLERLPGVACP